MLRLCAAAILVLLALRAAHILGTARAPIYQYAGSPETLVLHASQNPQKRVPSNERSRCTKQTHKRRTRLEETRAPECLFEQQQKHRRNTKIRHRSGARAVVTGMNASPGFLHNFFAEKPGISEIERLS
jgi:hypothetical protein